MRFLSEMSNSRLRTLASKFGIICCFVLAFAGADFGGKVLWLVKRHFVLWQDQDRHKTESFDLSTRRAFVIFYDTTRIADCVAARAGHGPCAPARSPHVAVMATSSLPARVLWQANSSTLFSTVYSLDLQKCLARIEFTGFHRKLYTVWFQTSFRLKKFPTHGYFISNLKFVFLLI